MTKNIFTILKPLFLKVTLVAFRFNTPLPYSLIFLVNKGIRENVCGNFATKVTFRNKGF